jgi:CheY-like chemotaxis protein
MASAIAGHHILVVEDEALVAADMAETLTWFGANVTVAELHGALAAMSAGQYAAAIVDYRLGDYDCTPLCEKLIELRIPFVICSGRHRFEGAALEGVYLAKPADPARLLSAVQSLLHSAIPSDLERIREKYSQTICLSIGPKTAAHFSVRCFSTPDWLAGRDEKSGIGLLKRDGLGRYVHSFTVPASAGVFKNSPTVRISSGADRMRP